MLVSGRTLFYNEVEKTTLKADELEVSQRHKDSEGNGKPLH